jgi:crotonobetainyl-CoA:carnitine CoA-transferase CaiB-like acyl-CoA transferase
VAGQDTDEALKAWGIDDARVASLRQRKAIG